MSKCQSNYQKNTVFSDHLNDYDNFTVRYFNVYV